MNVGKISIRYAKALYEFAASNNETQKVYEQVMSMEKNLCAEKNYRTYISIPTLSNNQKVEILKTYVGTTPCKSLEAFIVFLTQQNREESIRHICLSFVDYYRQREGISYCTLTSTTPLSEEETKKLKQLISKEKESKTTIINTVIDPELIGGFKLEINNYRLDASVKHELNEIKKSLVI